MRKLAFEYAETKTQISFVVTAKLINAFVFATRIVQSFYFLNPNVQASSNLLWLYSPVCVGPGRRPRRLVSSRNKKKTLGNIKAAVFIYVYSLGTIDIMQASPCKLY